MRRLSKKGSQPGKSEEIFGEANAVYVEGIEEPSGTVSKFALKSL